MISFADNSMIGDLEQMWKICFGDTDEYINLIFSKVFCPQNTLVYTHTGKVVASLQMWNYRYRYYGHDIPICYLSGLCTLPEYRNLGFMNKLINESFSLLKAREIPLVVLVPAEDWLYGYYGRFGFVQTFDKSERMIDLEKLYEEYKSDPLESFRQFDHLYQNQDAVVLKTFPNYEVIMTEFGEDSCLHHFCLGAMVKTLDFSSLFTIFFLNKLKFCLSIKVDYMNNLPDEIYQIKEGKCYSSDLSSYDLLTDEKSLTQYLLGYKNTLDNKYLHDIFESKIPTINLMLE